jgi:hypothetical protein
MARKKEQQMPGIEDIQSNFERKLDAHQAASEERLREDLAALRAALLVEAKNLPLPAAAGPDLLAGFDNRMHQALARRPAQGLVDFSPSPRLAELDTVFIRQFDLARYYPAERLRYLTIYCETLAEFFTPIVESMNLSPQARQQELSQMMAKAKYEAVVEGKGTYGVNLPGVGCYLNGWLFALGKGITPRAALDQALYRDILETAVHEKLGHGFLGEYSALGAVKTDLGLAKAQIAEQFGVRPADDPSASLQLLQHNLLFNISQLLEEGWATWVAGYLSQACLGGDPRPRYSLDAIVKVIKDMPLTLLPDVKDTQNKLLYSLDIVFGPQDAPLEVLNQAVNILEFDGALLDDYVGDKIGQPLRYAVGERIMMQAEINLGAGCVPYAALIAANVTFDPARISVNDLSVLLKADPRLNPDTRLVAISRLEPESRDDVPGLAKLAAAQLSISIPAELRI